MNKRRGFNLKDEYKKSWKYIKESKNFIYIIIGIFLLFAFAGFFIQTPDSIAEQILNFLQQLLEKTRGMSSGRLLLFIFFNNLQSSFFGIILGIIFGIFPILSAAVNGYVLGFVSFMSSAEEGFFVLLRILPHGIFELPAVFISLGIGLKLGISVFYEEKRKNFKNYFRNSLRVFLFIVIPLLIIAALIEGTLISLS